MSFNPNQGRKFAEVLKETSRVSEASSKEAPSKESSNYIKREKTLHIQLETKCKN